MPPGGISLSVAQHPCDFLNAIFAEQHLHIARCDPAPRLLRYDEMAVGPCCDLRQMRDHQHLMPLGDFSEC
jgi:hypothetical protein